jgi:NitT/TauT family transport system ATP-binding protein
MQAPASPTVVSDWAVQARGVSRRFVSKDQTVQALQDIDLDIRTGEFVSIVGPSGCGKSTLLNLIGGLLPPTAGEVRVAGQRVTAPPAAVGMMFQNPVLLDWRTARANVLLPLDVHGGRRAARQAEARADNLLRLVGLAGFEQRYPAELSGGMQQRVAICRMLIAEPAVLLLDEPFGALDELTREHLNVELERIVSSTGKTALLVTHNIQESVFLSDRVVVMTERPGRVAGVVPVDRPRPRTLAEVTSPEFQRLVGQVRALLGTAPARAAQEEAAR